MATSISNNDAQIQRPTTGRRSRTSSDSIDTLNELASFIPSYVNVRTQDVIPKKDEYLHKTSTLRKPYLENGKNEVIAFDSNVLNKPPQHSLTVPSGGCHNFRRSQSLKSSLRKSPSFNATNKKAVRFADSLGLDLEQSSRVQTVDPHVNMQIFVPYGPALCSSKPRFAPLFNLLSVMQIDKHLHKLHVCLESIAVGGYIIKGVIKVSNLSYHKRITVRYTVDDWLTCSDVEAAYIKYASDGYTDKFSFTIDLTLKSESVTLNRLEFAVRYVAENVGEFWDNNSTKNYCFKYEDPTKTLQTHPSWYDDAWLHFK